VKAVLLGGHLPTLNAADKYEVIDPEAQALYVFDRQGRHEATRGLFAQLTGFDFIYEAGGEGAGDGGAATTLRRLIQVVDKNMNVLELQRDEEDDSNHRLTGLVMPNGHEHSLKVNKNAELEQWRTPSNFVTAFHYRESGGGGRGLIAKMFVGGKMQNVFDYDDETSHITAIRSPVATGVSSHPAAQAGGRKHGLLTHAYLVRENQLIQQLFESEYLLNPLVAGRDTLLGNLTIHRLGWTYFQHEFRHVAIQISIVEYCFNINQNELFVGLDPHFLRLWTELESDWW
jgi:hypothetical protein